jgi:hypothetical protein
MPGSPIALLSGNDSSLGFHCVGKTMLILIEGSTKLLRFRRLFAALLRLVAASQAPLKQGMLDIPRVVQNPKHRHFRLVDRVKQNIGCRAWPASDPKTQFWPSPPDQGLTCKCLSFPVKFFQYTIGCCKVFFCNVNPGFQQIPSGAVGKNHMSHQATARFAKTLRPSALMDSMLSAAVRPAA